MLINVVIAVVFFLIGFLFSRKNKSKEVHYLRRGIKRILGFQEFLDYKKIEEYITSIDTEQNFDKNKAMLFEEQDGLRLWLIASNTDMFIVRDNGLHDLKILLKRNKTDFKSKIIFEKNEPRLYIENTTTTLPFDTNLTGGTESFQATIEKFIK